MPSGVYKRKPLSDETKKKISIANKGRKPSLKAIEKARQVNLINPARYWLGKKRDKETIDKIKDTKKLNPYPGYWLGKKRVNLRKDKYKDLPGKDYSYRQIHRWVESKFGKASELLCMFCNITQELRIIHWANISGEYNKEGNDWITLCSKCHGSYDKLNRDLSRS